nr:hypothetical protein [Tanacetum cinerariifolium]
MHPASFHIMVIYINFCVLQHHAFTCIPVHAESTEEMIKFSPVALAGSIAMMEPSRTRLQVSDDVPPLQLEGLPFELEWDLLPNYTIRHSNSFEWRKIFFGMITSMGILQAKAYTLRGRPSTKLEQRLFKAWQLSNHLKNLSISSNPDRAYICTISGAIRGTATISPVLTKLNNLKTTLPTFSGMINRREMTPPLGFSTLPQIPNITTSERPPVTTTVFAIRNEDLRIELEYFSEDYDEEREMEPRPEPRREATPTLRLREAISLRLAWGNFSPNGMLLSHHAQPFIPSSLHIPTRLTPIHVNPYSQPSSNFVYGQALNFPFQTQMGNPPAGGTLVYHPQGGYIPQAFTNNSVPSYNGPMHPTVTPLNLVGSVTLFVRWIEDYSLPDGLKMPSHVGSYNGKGDPDNFLHLFEGSILNYVDLKAKFQSHFSQQKKFTKTHLVIHNIKQREGESTRAFITRYTNDTLQTMGLREEKRISSFVHGLRTRSLVEHLSTDLPSTYKGLM